MAQSRSFWSYLADEKDGIKGKKSLAGEDPIYVKRTASPSRKP